LYLGFLCALYLEITNFIAGILAAVVLLIIALPLELVLSRGGRIAWTAPFPANSKRRKALYIAPVVLVAIVAFSRPVSTAPPYIIRDLSWLTAVSALYLLGVALRSRLLPPDREAPKRA